MKRKEGIYRYTGNYCNVGLAIPQLVPRQQIDKHEWEGDGVPQAERTSLAFYSLSVSPNARIEARI